MTLRLTDEEQAALKERADAAGISMQEAARQAVREYIARSEHRDRVMAVAARVVTVPREGPGATWPLSSRISWRLRGSCSAIHHRSETLACSMPWQRPRASAFGEDAYPDVWTKPGALLQSVVKNHALVDGSKRLGWLATAVLELNGVVATTASNDAVCDLLLGVAAGHLELAETAHRLRGTVTRRRR